MMKLVAGPYRHPGTSWIQRVYQHKTLGKFLIATLLTPGSCDLILVKYHFEWMRWRNRVTREQAEKERQQSRKGKGKGKGKGKPDGSERPPAAPLGGGKAA